MNGKRLKSRKAVALLCMAILLLLAACSGGAGGSGQEAAPPKEETADTGGTEGDKEEQPANPEPLKLSIMVQAFGTELPENDSIILKQVEEYTNTDIEMQFVPNSSYGDKVNITLASGQLPSIMVVDRGSASFINAARAGAFWELGPYLKDYPNLSQANPIILHNSSVDGKTYGIYRGRTLGRMGMIINKVWMDNLGLQPPKTIDEFYNLLKAFKEDDPDRDGKDDTYGIVITKYAGPWDIMQVWFGAPNKWGEGPDGKLVPTHLTPEYREALKFFRKLYAEGLVNEDFAVMDPAVWMDPMVNEQAGVVVDVADMGRRIDGKMQDKAKRDEPYMSVFQAPVGPKGHRDMPTSGYSGVLAVSKSAVKTEEELKRVLEFLDKLNDEEMQMLLGYGVEGRHYNMVDGYIKPIESEDPALKKERESLNQMLMFIGPTTPTLEPTPINKMVADVQKANEEIVVGNPAEPLVSEVYAQKGQQLDNIIADARIQYIVGQIDDQGLQAAIDLWRKTGGDEYVEEINKLYEATKQ
ncbi:extracellular solute-binding protein [Paenibacillus alkalitolerans]|uniref:extracellular solute-binding protein n=1 Tax=Paenibacillus alkalitolerans TaxID=2799335 RepID=UPI0018F6A92B|nr:extracellular solute-binding protein [Paenibacillus alkalitolerans]